MLKSKVLSRKRRVPISTRLIMRLERRVRTVNSLHFSKVEIKINLKKVTEDIIV